MRIILRAITRVIAVTALLAVTTVNALAYLDPGTGSIILQGLIAAFAAVAVTARIYWRKITNFLRDPLSRRREQDEDEPRNDES